MKAKVLIEYKVKSLDKTFNYLIPGSLENILKVGMKVIVPFGNSIVNGFVVGFSNEDDGYELKEIIRIVDEDFVLNKELLLMGSYLKEKTLCSLMSAYQTMLPSSMKVKTINNNYQLYDKYISLNKKDYEINKYILEHPRALKQIDILERLIIEKRIEKKEISSNSLNILLKKNLVKEEKEVKYRIQKEKEKTKKINLSFDQNKAIKEIKNIFNHSKTFLIRGVTGSGKTEIYIELINEVIKMGKTAIMLVPEISLTTQIMQRFYNNFGSDVAIIHSKLSDGEKYDEYQKIMKKEVHVVIGTRSAIFVPLTNIGIIIMDEEHSDNYKQDNNPRYHAFDMAQFRSKYHKCPIVLGSATPSLESMARAYHGVYGLIELNKRVKNSQLPDVFIVDMAEEMKKRNMILSDLLKEKIIEKINKKEQVILLLNRRGFSTIITCQNCGFTYKCPHCDISLTYHKSTNNLRCHYCGYTIQKPIKCDECHHESLNFYGLGTEKLEVELNKMFKVRIVRMDMDTTTKKNAYETIINDFQNHQYDILLGTQMISKGLDFPNVTLVGIINADTSLNIPDFRSGERTFQLLNQVAGRAGRDIKKGEVIIQSFNPDNYVINYVKNNDYLGFYQQEMNLRKALSYPPYYYLTSIKIISKEYETASQEAIKVKRFLTNNLKKTIILGPTTAMMFKVKNDYRFQIVLKYKKDAALENTLKSLDEQYIINNKVRIEIDTNPYYI